MKASTTTSVQLHHGPKPTAPKSTPATTAPADGSRTLSKPTIRSLAKAAKEIRTHNLAEFLKETGHELQDLYRGSSSWTTIRRRAGLLPNTDQHSDASLLGRVHAFLHVDDAERIDAYRQLLADDAPSYEALPRRNQTLARMLFFNLWDNAGGYTSYTQGLDSLRTQAAFRSELTQVLDHLNRRSQPSQPLQGDHAHIPLHIHRRYNRSEILAAMGVAYLGGQMPRHFAQGVLWDKKNRTDVLLITLRKEEKDYSPTVRYKDYAQSPTQLHWESQSTTKNTSTTGQRYIHHKQRGSHILPFMRPAKDSAIGKAEPWMLVGPATYLSHTGSEPMAITWDLAHELPAQAWNDARSHA